MKHFISLTFIVSIVFTTSAQVVDSTNQESEIFKEIEESASYPGGIREFMEFLKENLRYPRTAQRMGIEGRVFVQFIVERDGSLSDAEVVKGIGAGCDEEAVRVIELMPKWIPGKINGEPVRQKIVQTILFKFADSNFSGDRMSREEIDELFTIVESPAQFPGGIQEFYNFLSRNLVYPKYAYENKIEGTVFVQFVVGKDGVVSDYEVVKGAGHGFDEEALRVLNMMPNWTPAEQRGEKVAHKMVQTIYFKFPSDFTNIEDALLNEETAKGLALPNSNIESLDERITRLKKLRLLNVDNNKISDLSPITTLPIEELYASGNSIEKLPLSFSNLRKLRILSLNGNSIGKFPMEALELENLEVLDLSFNQIESIPNQIYRLKKLRILSIQGNKKIKDIPEEMKELKSLEAIYVGKTGISRKQLKSLVDEINGLVVFLDVNE